MKPIKKQGNNKYINYLQQKNHPKIVTGYLRKKSPQKKSKQYQIPTRKQFHQHQDKYLSGIQHLLSRSIEKQQKGKKHYQKKGNLFSTSLLQENVKNKKNQMLTYSQVKKIENDFLGHNQRYYVNPQVVNQKKHYNRDMFKESSKLGYASWNFLPCNTQFCGDRPMKAYNNKINQRSTSIIFG